MKSFKPEVIADSSGKWCGNSLRFETREEAEGNVFDLSMRWMLVRETRVVESEDPPTHRWIDGALVDIKSGDSRGYRGFLTVERLLSAAQAVVNDAEQTGCEGEIVQVNYAILADLRAIVKDISHDVCRQIDEPATP